MKEKLFLIYCFLALLLISLACRMPVAPRIITEAPGFLYTQAADTLSAQIDVYGELATLAKFTQMAKPATQTPVGFSTQQNLYVVTATPIPPTLTSFPTSTASPSPTSSPTATEIPELCDHASFIKDVTIPDGTAFNPGAEFSKIWRLRNIGTCSWNKNYSLVFTDGDFMGVSKDYPINGYVDPGETVDIGVDLTAPTTPGKYESDWMLMNTEKELFGTGVDAQNAIWTRIKVNPLPEDWATDLATNMCVAKWTSSAGDLPCPGNTKSEDGSVTFTMKPYFESDRHDDEPTIISRAEPVKNGWIKGAYPLYKVRDKDHFQSYIGCLYGYEGCKVTFTVQYQVPGNTVKTLGQWAEVYDGMINYIDVDLSFLAGKSVQFFLIVTNNAKNAEDYAFWFTPWIKRITNSPTKTPTPTATKTSTPTATLTRTPTATTNPYP